jgi:hypothetical protein
MKYEVTQEQYVDFLNTISLAAQMTRVQNTQIFTVGSTGNQFVMSNTSTPMANNGIKCPAIWTVGTKVEFYCDYNNNDLKNENGDAQNTACNFLSYNDAAAYADWACLRPMTELEYEKACRGPVYPVPNEGAWGNSEFTHFTQIINVGRNDETPSDGNINYVLSGLILRVGSFARSNSTRASSGASFWGIMNLSDNAAEFVINISTPAGRSFTNECGDGNIGTLHDVSTWPTNIGYGLKAYQRVSNRAISNGNEPLRTQYDGARFVRPL